MNLSQNEACIPAGLVLVLTNKSTQYEKEKLLTN